MGCKNYNNLLNILVEKLELTIFVTN